MLFRSKEKKTRPSPFDSSSCPTSAAAAHAVIRGVDESGFLVAQIGPEMSRMEPRDGGAGDVYVYDDMGDHHVDDRDDYVTLHPDMTRLDPMTGVLRLQTRARV